MMRAAASNNCSLVSRRLQHLAALAAQRRQHAHQPYKGEGWDKGTPNYDADRRARAAERNAQRRKEWDAEMKLREEEDAIREERKIEPAKPYFARGAWAPAPEKHKPSPPGESDTIHVPEYNTAFGKFEIRPPDTGMPGIEKFFREPPDNISSKSRITGVGPLVDPNESHHPLYDYTSDSGVREGYNTKMAGATIHWDEKVAMHSLYRAALRGLPLVKQFYYLLCPLDSMKRRIRERFEANRYIQDREAIRMLIFMGWQDYTEIICFRRTKASVGKHFMDDEQTFDMMKHYANEEGKQIEDRRIHAGGYQSKDGPYSGFWSLAGKQCAEEFEKLEGRIPVSYTASKGYFEVWKADGTNFWEKNMDYEGWYIKNVDPDRASARKEIAAWVEAGYNQPRHYASKNRRGYRRFVRDIDAMMNMTTHEAYAATRENMFHSFIREWCPESNRLYAEKKLARNDDNVFTSKFDEYDAAFRQAVREFPNPRLWKTDAFYLRMRQLTAHMEYNWAKAPIGVELERAFNEWISLDAHYAAFHSATFATLKTDKTRNPMAKSWADFYSEFDPDVPETRRLPWYHKDFDYDRRYHWDERCMRMKKWVQSGDIDFRRDFFSKEVAEYEQMVNRPEIVRKPECVELRYTAPRMVQLYRSLGKRMDVALANQVLSYTCLRHPDSPLLTKDAIHSSRGNEQRVAEIKALIDSTDFTDFKFDVPVVIYPDNVAQPAQLGIDGRPMSSIAA